MSAPEPLALGSLCSGYGGLEMAVAQVFDVRPVWVAKTCAEAAMVSAEQDPRDLTEGAA